jgi:hypothetical protein
MLQNAKCGMEGGLKIGQSVRYYFAFTQNILDHHFEQETIEM